MNFLKQLGERFLYVIAGLLIIGFGVLLLVYYFAKDSSRDIDLKIGLGAIVLGAVLVFFGFSSKKEFNSTTEANSSPDKKDEQTPPS